MNDPDVERGEAAAMGIFGALVIAIVLDTVLLALVLAVRALR